MFVVIAYDIEDDKRRNKVFKVLKNFGQWMQFSVFECNITKEQFFRLSRSLEKLINPEHDSIRYYFLCETCVKKVIRVGGVKVRDESMFIV